MDPVPTSELLTSPTHEGLHRSTSWIPERAGACYGPWSRGPGHRPARGHASQLVTQDLRRFLTERETVSRRKRHSRPRRPVHHRDLRARLDRGETQSPRSRLRPGRQRRADRMEPRPRTAQLARQSLTTSRYAQRFGRQPRSLRELQASTAHNPALLIYRLKFTSGCQRPISTGERSLTCSRHRGWRRPGGRGKPVRRKRSI